ncbi:RAMP superfamily CRISPR-associated protein [Aporhodopirellula aestuarii]|uniref:RAMP superfamily CRISPR-associated protein n=1 Tax=Aporhodopirellula aestuarii TaxID=2950107 RepID=A0ABT0U2F0_9BACT|nr:RAMP superfamily CRISPR-associated protein [Aporhodopirellula aestuarii]MCM2371069.1 RAMP superfamily CRISPR-associated protein [Aporhodopirellula aestuarii]
MTTIDKLFFPIEFPEGVAPGEGTQMNVATISRDGIGRYVLRGTAIAGCLRSKHSRRTTHEGAAEPQATKYWFGSAADDENVQGSLDEDSRLVIETAVLDVGRTGEVLTTHHQRNRHTGVVADAGLFTVASCPPGTSTIIAIEVKGGDEFGGTDGIIQFLHETFAAGIQFGGKTARGVGRSKLSAEVQHRRYHMRDVDDVAAYLQETRAWQTESTIPESAAKLPNANVKTVEDQLHIQVTLQLARGQDILIAQGADSRMMRVRSADGAEHWRIPGSTWRGALRSWMTRLAAINGATVNDSYEYFSDLPTEKRSRHPDAKSMKEPECPINDLFGTTASAGRIHIADTLVPAKHGEEQFRMHVAIDRVTGGAAEGLLFQNTVLTRGSEGPKFSLGIQIDQPSETEVQWLAESLLAIHHGVLRIGSSKASGRLEMNGQIQADGQHADLFRQTVEQYFAPEAV